MPRRWTPEEIKILIQEREGSKSFSDIAAEISKKFGTGRTAGAAKRRWYEQQPQPHRPAKKMGVHQQIDGTRSSKATCQWPFGDPKKPGFYFCGEEVVPGKPYCRTHLAASRASRQPVSIDI